MSVALDVLSQYYMEWLDAGHENDGTLYAFQGGLDKGVAIGRHEAHVKHGCKKDMAECQCCQEGR